MGGQGRMPARNGATWCGWRVPRYPGWVYTAPTGNPMPLIRLTGWLGGRATPRHTIHYSRDGEQSGHTGLTMPGMGLVLGLTLVLAVCSEPGEGLGMVGRSGKG